MQNVERKEYGEHLAFHIHKNENKHLYFQTEEISSEMIPK